LEALQYRRVKVGGSRFELVDSREVGASRQQQCWNSSCRGVKLVGVAQSWIAQLLWETIRLGSNTNLMRDTIITQQN
jgi:hypothetical protein